MLESERDWTYHRYKNPKDAQVPYLPLVSTDSKSMASSTADPDHKYYMMWLIESMDVEPVAREGWWTVLVIYHIDELSPVTMQVLSSMYQNTSIFGLILYTDFPLCI